ncbi:DUF2752 domain-containing protein [Bacteroides sp.]|uniref:DUF2752 domain-containing protein n=1 Tax=Bacteroides sp. TaxID=29523 RepID=UPI003A94094D
MKRKGIWIVGILLIGLIYFSFNPSRSAIFPKCPFFALTGLKCPGCGSQRAIHSLLHFNYAEAFRHNALLVVSLPLIIVLMHAELNRERYPHLYIKLHNTTFIWSYFVIVIAWWISRNIFQF